MQIFFQGKPVAAREGDTVASALFRAGRRVFTRSFKYHRPRGLLCAAGRCPNCLMNVDGVPNVRTCVEPARDGMQVRLQNALPSLERDALSVVGPLGRFFPVGFYYKTFINRHYWHAAEPVIRRIAGLGVAPGDPGELPSAADGGAYEHQSLHAEVAVVGGGAAGMAAALAAAQAGAEVLLIDDQPEPGGQLRTDRHVHPDAGEFSGLPGTEIARALAASLAGTPAITVLRGAAAFGCYEGLLLGVIQGNRLIHLRARRLVVATGAFEYPPVFRNNDLPGVMLGSAAQGLIRLHEIQPGKRALVVTNNDFGLQVACDLLDAGVEVAGVAHAAAVLPDSSAAGARLRAADVPLLAGRTIQAALGKGAVSGAITVAVGADGGTQQGTEQTVACDLICLSLGRAAASGLLSQSGCSLEFSASPGMFVPAALAPNVYAAGEVAGEQGLAACLASGEAAGRHAAHPGASLPAPPLPHSPTPPPLSHSSPTPPLPPCLPIPHSALRTPHSETSRHFVCLCMDVTEKDVRDAVAEAFDEMELLKRYATFGMGPCQGKMCGMNNVAACARETGRTLSATGTTTARPPLQPIRLGALAGASHHPVKRTAMHSQHLDLGARMMDMGEWKRPLYYGSVSPFRGWEGEWSTQSAIEGEYRAVRERVGLIDVSTLGKLDVKGRDAGKLLDRVYTHVFSTLPLGRTRYGVICDDAGIILDDGTVTRLADDHYFITTTTGNIEFVEQWLGWWSAGTGMCVHVTNVTAGYASVNLAGPRARETLAKLTSLDLSSEAFPYMASARAQVAGAEALLLRLGFVGETGWEIHFPAEYGETVWSALLDAGKEFGIAPFGIEAQRLLRLEKKHVIVGVDTDALTNPLEAGMEWAVRWEKPEFIGKRSLLAARGRGPRSRLVGFTVRDSAVPQDGCAVVSNGALVGRVTSCRHSPHAGRAIGLAWTPAAQSAPGAAINIRLDGRDVAAEVTDRPFYDPEGARLRT